MADTPSPFRYRSIRTVSLLAALAGAMVGIVFLGVGLYQLTPWSDSEAGGATLLAGLILVILSLFMYAALEMAIQMEANINRIYRSSVDLLIVLRRIDPLVKVISDNSQLSDAAKTLARREFEHDALRQAIREEMYSGDVEAAQYLISEMERRFGYQQEAQALRHELNQMREMTIEEKINEAVSHIEKLMSEYRWPRAAQEVDRLMKLFPRHERVQNLPAELGRRREARKQDLLNQWKVAVQRAEVDRGIAILTELDQYLTKPEAEALQESARHVFKARLVNLSVQFGLAVSEQRWRDALEVGLQIRQEFPNSRVAHEVTEKLETLRLKAGFVADADVIQHHPAPPEPG